MSQVFHQRSWIIDYVPFPLYSNAQCSSSTILANHSYSSNPNVTYAPHDYPFSPAISFHVRNSFAKQPRTSSSARFSLSHNELVSEGITKRGKFLGQTCIERIRNRFCTVLQTLSLTLWDSKSSLSCFSDFESLLTSHLLWVWDNPSWHLSHPFWPQQRSIWNKSLY